MTKPIKEKGIGTKIDSASSPVRINTKVLAKQVQYIHIFSWLTPICVGIFLYIVHSILSDMNDNI